MGKKRKFKVDDEVYNVEESSVDAFLEAAPEAKEVKTYIIGEDKYDVELESVSDFLNAAPDAKEYGVEEVEKKSPDETGAPAPAVTAGSGKPSVEKPEFTGKEFAPAKTTSEVEAEALTRVSEKAAPVVQAEAKKKPEGLTVDEIIEKRFYPKKETIQVDPKDRDTFVKGLMSIPANKRHKGGYIEGFHKKTNVDKRALRKFYDEVVETEKRIAQLEEELHPQPKVSEAPAKGPAGVPEMGFQQPQVSLPEYTPPQKELTPPQKELTPLQQQIVQASQEPTQKINTAGIDIGMRNQQIFKPMVIDLPEVTITAPNDPNKVKELADSYAFIGDYDKARDGYKELESLLKDLAEQELKDKNFRNKAPKNYIEQRQAPATQGIAYMEYKRGNKEESRRIYEILNNKNLIDFSPELTQVGSGDVLQPGAERTQVGAEMDVLQALKSREISPDTKAGEYIKSIAKALEDLTYIPQVQEMTTAAVEKMARTGEVYDKEGFLSAAFNGLVGTGELLLAAASYTPGGAKFVIPFIQAQQSLPENLQFVLAPWHAAMQSAYGKETMPDYLNNTAAVLDFLTLGVAIHSAPKVTKKVQSRIASMKAGEMMNRDIYTRIYMEEVLNDLTPAEREAMVKEMERKAKKDPNYAQKTIQTAEEVGNTIISTANDINEISAEPTESYSKKRVPKTTNDLTTGQMVEMNGERKRFGYNDKGEAILENVETGDQQVIAKVNEVKDLADLDITVEDMPNDSQVNKMIAEADETFIFASKNGKTYRIVRDKVNGDFVFEVTTNDNLVNTLDMIGNEKAAKERKLEIINEAYTQQGKPTVRSLNEPKTEAYEVPDGMIAFEAETINASGGKGQYLFYDKKGNARVITEAEYIRLKGLGKPIKGVAEVMPVEEGMGVEAEAAPVAEEGVPTETEAAPAEAKPAERAPQVGDTVELPPVREGFGNRKMVFTEEGWQQQVGDITTKVGTMAQEAAQSKFMEQFAEVKPKAEMPKVEEVKLEEPVVEEVKAEEPVAEEAKPEPFSPQMKDAYKRQASDAFQGKAAAENFEYKDVTATVKKVEGKKQADVSMSDQSPDAAKVLESIVTKADESKVRLNVKAEPAQQPFYEKFGFKFEGNKGVREHTQKRVAQEKKQKVMSALDALENALLDLPGIKEVAPGAKKAGAPITAADSVKFIMKGIRKAVETGLTINEAIADVMVELKNSKYADILKTIAEKDLVSTIRKVANQEFEKTGLPPEQWGISKAMTDAERQYLGASTADEITAGQRRTIAEMQAAGEKIPVERVLKFADRVIQDRLTVSPEEQLAMGNAVFELKKKRIRIQDEIKAAREAGNQSKVDLLLNQMEMTMAEGTKVLEALAVTRSEIGRGLGLGKYLYQSDFSVENMSREYEAVTGKAPTMQMIENFERLENDYNSLQAEYDAIQAQRTKVKEQTALDDIKEAIEREKNKPKPKEPTKPKEPAKPKTAEEKKISTAISNFAKRVEQQKIRRGDKFYSSVVPGGPEAWNLGVTAVATTLKAAAKTASAIENAIIKGKEAIMATDWYKSLNEQRQFESLNEFDTIMRDEFQRSSKGMASVDEAGRVKIPFDLIKEFVEEGVENADDLTQKLFDAIYDDVIAEKPDLSLQDVKDGWTDYGRKVNPNPDPLLAEIRKLKRDGKLERALEDVEGGKLPLRSGYQREKMTDYQRELDKNIKELLKEFPEDQADIDKNWASALTRIKTMLINKIKDTQKRIDDIEAGRPVRPVEKKKIQLDDEALLLKEELKALKETLTRLEGDQSADYKGKVLSTLNALDRSIAEYERRMEEIRQTGTFSEKPTKPGVTTPKIEAKKNELKTKKEQYEQALSTTDIPKTRALRTAVKNLENEIKELESQLASGDVSFMSKLPGFDRQNPLYKAAKERVKELKEERDRIRKESGMADLYEREVYRKRLSNKLADLQRRIDEKDFSTKEKKEVMFDEDIARLEYEIAEKKFQYEVLKAKAEYDALDPSKKALESIYSLFGLPKTLNASMDLSAVLRQGIILSLSHPLEAFIGKPGKPSAFAEMLKQAGSEKAVEQFEIAVRSDRVFPIAKESGLYFSEKNAKLTAMEEELIGKKFIKKLADLPAKTVVSIPFKIFEGSNRAYTAYLNKIRFDCFKNFYESLVRDGFKGTELESNLKAYATFLNNSTGRGKLGKIGNLNLEPSLPLFNSLFFAPRFVASRISNLFNSLTLYSNPYYPMRVKVEAYRSMVAYLGVVSTTMILAKNMGAEVEVNPLSSDFGKIKVGNTRYDLFAGHQQLVVLFMKCMEAAEKSAATGVTKQYYEGYNPKTRDETLIKFLRSKASPTAGIAYDYLKGEFFDRTPFEWSKAVQRVVVPLIIQDMKSIYEIEGIEGVAKTFPFTFFGVGTQTFEEPEYMKGMDNEVRSAYENYNYQPMGYSDATYYRPGSKKELQLTEEQIKTINDKAYKIINDRLNKAIKGSGIVYVKEGYSINIKKADPDAFKRAMDTMYRAEYKKQKDRILGAGNYKNTPAK